MMKTKINWLEWNSDSFRKAKKEGKPILLDLTAVWCHWCHVMDSTSYSDDKIVQIINQGFVPIKVYIDERPDIRDRYNMGGFPSTVFLDSEGEIILGDTYVPPERLKLILENVKDKYEHDKNTKKSSKQIFLPDSNSYDKKFSRTKFFDEKCFNKDIIKEVLISIEDNFDSFYGGFGTQPKFPSPEAIDLLFIQHIKTKNRKYLDMALKTLDAMHDGIYDKTDFGFFRYSVTQDWKMPHYEKMLDTNAGLMRNYAMAFEITKNKKYKETAAGILNYINKFLSDQENGGFYGSQDADEEFYNLSLDERKKKHQPSVDKKVYIDWNAMMVSSYLKAGEILVDKKAVEFAMKTVDFILKNYYTQENGVSHFFDEKTNISGLLSDNIYFLNCLIDVYSITKNSFYFGKIKTISEFILKNFYSENAENSAGFLDRTLKENDLGKLKNREKQFLENCFSSIVFLRIYALTKEEKYKQSAEKTLIHFADSYLNFGYFAANYAIAVGMLLS